MIALYFLRHVVDQTNRKHKASSGAAGERKLLKAEQFFKARLIIEPMTVLHNYTLSLTDALIKGLPIVSSHQE